MSIRRVLSLPGVIASVSADGKTVSGRAPANAPVYLRKNGTLVATLLASVAGVWSFTFPQTVFTNDVLDVATTVHALTVPLQPVSLAGTPTTAPLNAGYTWTPTVYNGSGARAFNLSGTLPAGLSFSSTTGAISGTASAAGTQSIGITVTDATGSFTLSTSITASAASLPAGGLGEWRFAEGSGTTVADAIGSNPINLNLPTNPNYTWNSKGVSLSAGLVQTPSIANCRSRAMLYWVGRGESTGFIMSGGSATNQGIIGPTATKVAAVGGACLVSVASGYGVRPLYVRTDGGTNSAPGLGGNILNRGNWVLVFEDFNASYTTAHGLLGRAGATTSRCASGGVAWFYTSSAAWSDADRVSIANYVRSFIAVPRGIYIDYRDCPTIVKAIGQSGQSNGDGRALISQLSAQDLAQTYPDVKIIASSGGADASSTYPLAQLQLGVNQQKTTPAGQFGPEIGMAMRHEALHAGTPLWMSKTAVGSTYGVPSSLGNGVTASNTWHPDEVANGSLFGGLLTWVFDLEAAGLNAGIGVQFVFWFHMQGEQDATNSIFANVYQAALQRFYDQLQYFTNYSGLRFVVGQIAGHDPAEPAAPTVQAAQAAFVAANSNARLVVTSNTATYPMSADNVHYNAAAQKTLGMAVYDVGMAA